MNKEIAETELSEMFMLHKKRDPDARLSLVAAINNLGFIGKAGKLPWHDSDDLERFFALIKNRSVIVGSTTYASLPKGALKRLQENTHKIFVCSRTKDAHYTFEDAVKEAPDAFVIGGAQIYKRAIESGKVKYWYITRVDDDTYGDTPFPADLGVINS